MELIVNGEPRTAERGETILGLLRSLDLEPERVAVELDQQIVRKAQWEITELREGAKIEIVQFVGGG